MSVSKFILFCTSNSIPSLQTIKYIQSQNLPAQYVRLDTKEARKLAENGKYFKIQYVPTLLVLYDDGNLQLFEGKPKILQFFHSYIQSKRMEQAQEMAQQNVEEDNGFIQNMPSQPSTPRKIVSRDSHRRVNFDEDEDDDNIDNIDNTEFLDNSAVTTQSYQMHAKTNDDNIKQRQTDLKSKARQLKEEFERAVPQNTRQY